MPEKIIEEFKETENRTIPKGWGVVRLDDVVDKIIDNRGKTPPLTKSGHELLEVNSIKAGRRSPDYTEVEKFVDEATYKSWFRTGHISKGDLIIPTVGTIGNLAISLEDRGSIAQNLIALRLNKKTDSSFIYYLLSSPDYKERLLNLDIGGVQPSIKVPHLMNLEILIPELLEQKKIAEILSSLDDKIELNCKINTNLEKLAVSLFKKCFVNNVDRYKNVKLGEVLSAIESGRRPKGGAQAFGVPSVGAENINGLGYYNYPSTKYIPEEFYEEMKTGKVKDYDILLYKDGAYIGRKTMFGLGFPFDKFAVNEHVFILRSDSNLIGQFYLYFYLNQVDVTENIQHLNTNSAQPGINQDSIKNFEIKLPPKEIVDKFNTITKEFVSLILKNSVENRELAILRNLLLPRLMNGKIKININI